MMVVVIVIMVMWILTSYHLILCGKGGGTGGAIAPPLFTDHLKIIKYSDTQNGS